MRLFVLGATGRTGAHLVDEALRRGHRVTALVRGPSMPPPREGLAMFAGDPRDPARLATLLPGHDVLISCLGQRTRDDAGLLGDVAVAMVATLRASGVARCLVVSQGLHFPLRNPLLKLIKRILARHVIDSGRMEDTLRASDLDWTIVRAPRLLDGGARRGYTIAVDARPPGRGSMRRVDLADFLLDEAVANAHRRQVVGITSR